MNERIQKLKAAVETTHACTAKHTHSAPVKDMSQGKTVWEGVVEAFALTGHPTAQRAYAWSYQDKGGEQIASVLEVGPVISPLTAIKSHFAGQGPKKA